MYKNRRLERRRWAVYFNQGPLVSIEFKDNIFLLHHVTHLGCLLGGQVRGSVSEANIFTPTFIIQWNWAFSFNWNQKKAPGQLPANYIVSGTRVSSQGILVKKFLIRVTWRFGHVVHIVYIMSPRWSSLTCHCHFGQVTKLLYWRHLGEVEVIVVHCVTPSWSTVVGTDCCGITMSYSADHVVAVVTSLRFTFTNSNSRPVGVLRPPYLECPHMMLMFVDVEE